MQEGVWYWVKEEDEWVPAKKVGDVWEMPNGRCVEAARDPVQIIPQSEIGNMNTITISPNGVLVVMPQPGSYLTESQTEWLKFAVNKMLGDTIKVLVLNTTLNFFAVNDPDM